MTAARIDSWRARMSVAQPLKPERDGEGAESCADSLLDSGAWDEHSEPEFVEALFDSMNRNGIEYAVLHGVESIPNEVRSDIDMVVRPASMNVLAGFLDGFARQRGGLLCQVIRHEATARYHVLALPGPNGAPSFIKIDASTDYRRDGRVLFTGAELFAEARLQGGFRAVSMGVEFTAYLAKCVLKRSVSVEQLGRLARLWTTDTAGCRHQCEALLSPRDVDLVAAVMTGDLVDEAVDQLLALRPRFLRGALVRHPLGALLMPPRNAVRFLTRVTHRTGLQIALLGPDGVGKSTVLDGLAKLAGPAFRQTQQIHLRPGLLPAGGATKSAAGAVPYTRAVYGTLRSIMKLCYLTLDYGLGYWIRIWPRLVASTLVLCDRYFLDVVADPDRYRYGGPRRLPLLLARAIPGPDVYIVLTAAAETVQSRKQEVTLAQTERQSRSYAQLSEIHPRVVVVDCEQSVDAVRNEVAWTVLRALSASRI